MELKDAIEISRIISKAPEERLPMILSVLEKAEVSIDGLDELEEWKTYKDMNAIVDFGEFMEAFKKRFAGRLDNDRYKVPTAEFGEFCKEQKLKPTPVRRWLAKKDIIEVGTDNGKINYTVTATIDGKTMRCVVVKAEWDKEGSDRKDETTESTNP
jgi:hypothetical protein